MESKKSSSKLIAPEIESLSCPECNSGTFLIAIINHEFYTFCISCGYACAMKKIIDEKKELWGIK